MELAATAPIGSVFRGRLITVMNNEQEANTMFNLWKHKVPPGKHSHITKEFLQAERDAGKTVKQIAKDNNIPSGTISTLLQKHGVSKKRS